MKITRRRLRRMISELSFTRNSGYESERWQQETLNKVQLENKLKQIQQALASKGVELVILTDDEVGSLADNEVKVFVRRKKTGLMGALGRQQEQSFMFYAWPNGISVKDMASSEDPLSLNPGQVDRWLTKNITENITVHRLRRLIKEYLENAIPFTK